MPKTSPSERPAAAFAKSADAKAAKLADKALAAAKQPFRNHDERSVHATRPPPARLDVRLLSKREVLAIVGVSYPTLWSMMRANSFPRSRKVGGQSRWLSSEVAAWLAALPRSRLKGDDAPPKALRDDKQSEVTPAPHIEKRKARR
jgi:predicted DNA-binding transcriptional regulator AlpA